MPPLPPWILISLRSMAVYVVILAGLRLAGKRHAGQISPHDFVLILLVSNAVQNAMVGSDTSLSGGLAAAATLIALNFLITRFVLRHERLGRYLSGEPTLLVHNGKVIEEHLRRECILHDELEMAIREHGFEGASAVKSAVQEVDGTISVIGFGEHKESRIQPLQRRRHGRRGKHV